MGLTLILISTLMSYNVKKLPKGTLQNQVLSWDTTAGDYVLNLPTQTYNTSLTGILTPAQQTALNIGITKNLAGETWVKTSDGIVTKIEDLKAVCILSAAQTIPANGFFIFNHQLNDANPSITGFDGAGVVLINQPNIAFSVVDANNVRVDIGSVPVVGFKIKVCGGAMVTYAQAPLAGVTNNISSAGNTISSVVNGGSAASAPIINTNVVTLTGQNLSTTVNGVLSNVVTLPPAPGVSSNVLSLTGSNLTSTVNGVASNSITLPTPAATATTNTASYVVSTGVLTSTVNGVTATTTIPTSNMRVDKIIPVSASGNYVVNPAVDVPQEINGDGRAIWKKSYNGNFTGGAAVTALQTDEAYLVHVTNHYRITTAVTVPGSVRTRVDFMAGGLSPVNPTQDSQHSTDMVVTNNLQLNTDQSISRYYYGESALSYFQQEIHLHLPDSIKTTYPTITIEEQKMEIIVYIVKKNVYVSTPITIY
jgi:hypothetical protein